MHLAIGEAVSYLFVFYWFCLRYKKPLHIHGEFGVKI